MSKLTLNEGWNGLYTIDDLPLTDDQKEMVLEWFAQKIWQTLMDTSHHKSYDPLIIEGHTAHSHVFNMTVCGRHHYFENLKELEKLLCNEMKEHSGAEE